MTPIELTCHGSRVGDDGKRWVKNFFYFMIKYTTRTVLWNSWWQVPNEDIYLSTCRTCNKNINLFFFIIHMLWAQYMQQIFPSHRIFFKSEWWILTGELERHYHSHNSILTSQRTGDFSLCPTFWQLLGFAWSHMVRDQSMLQEITLISHRAFVFSHSRKNVPTGCLR